MFVPPIAHSADPGCGGGRLEALLFPCLNSLALCGRRRPGCGREEALVFALSGRIFCRSLCCLIKSGIDVLLPLFRQKQINTFFSSIMLKHFPQ